MTGVPADGRPREGLIFDVQRFCLHDGPGVRTVLFLKGCGLSCQWCCNPESQSVSPEILFDAERCIGCGRCVSACPRGAIAASFSTERINRSRCDLCGACAKVCPSGAIRMAGRAITVTQALEETLRDRSYYEISRGGVTLSGGEPLLQVEFAVELLSALKHRRVHTAVETAGCVPWKAFAQSLPFTDLYLFDVKHVRDHAHRAGTGRDNGRILENLARLSEHGAEIVLRYVLIPDYNMDDDAVAAFADLALRLHLQEVQLLAYHRLGAGKYGELGRNNEQQEKVPPTECEVEAVRDRLASALRCTVNVA